MENGRRNSRENFWISVTVRLTIDEMQDTEETSQLTGCSVEEVEKAVKGLNEE